MTFRIRVLHKGRGLANTNLGLDLTSLNYFAGTRPYSNLIHGSGWIVSGGTGAQNVPLPAGHTDANGNVTSLPGDYTTLTRFLAVPINSASCVATWTGHGTAHVSLSGSMVSAVDNSVAHQTTFTYATNYSDPNWFATGAWTTLSYTFNPADPLLNLDVREVGKSTSQKFENDYLSAASGYNVIRFNNGWQVAVSTDPGTFPTTVPSITWATRNQPGAKDLTVNDGVPIEDMVAFANQTNTNPWFCMPWGADDTYITNFATYVLNNLNSNLKVYVENDNEIWNFGFTATKQAKAEGLSEGLGALASGVTISSITFSGTVATVTTSTAHGMAVTAGPGNNVSVNVTGASPSAYNAGWVDVQTVPTTNSFTYNMASTPASNATVVGSYQTQTGTLALQRRYAEKSAHVLGLWATVFAGQMSRLVRVAAFQNADTSSPPNTLAYNSNMLAIAIDAIASAPYWGADTGSAEYSGATADTALNTLLPSDLAQTIGFAKSQYATAQSFGKRYIAYEGGQNMTGSNVTLIQSIERDSRMYSLYGTFLADWLIQCGGDILALTNIASPINQFGAWGLVEFVGQTVSKATTPKLQLVNDWRSGVRFPQTLTATLSCAANSSNGFVVGTVAGFYPGSTLSIQSTGPTDGSGLAVNSTTGAITVANSANLPAQGSYSVTVRETNSGFAAGHQDSVISWTVSVALNNTHAYRYYYLEIDNPMSNNGDIQIRRFEIMAIPGSGVDSALGQVATATSFVSGNPPQDAITADGTVWKVGTLPDTLKVDYGATSSNWVAANEFTIVVPSGITGPVAFKMLGSDDDVSMTTLKTISFGTASAAQTSWTANLSQTFDV